MTNRRDFVKMLALLAAGAAALPEQIVAFEKYYDTNTPRDGTSFVAIDEVSVSGLVANKSCPLRVDFLHKDNLALACALNAFGGVYFWRAAPDGKIVARPGDVTWRMLRVIEGVLPDDLWVRTNLAGHISYIDTNSVRHMLPITKAVGSI